MTVLAGPVRVTDSLTYKSLADGQLSATKATLYTCPTGLHSFIKTIFLVNTDSSTRTINLYFKASGGTSRRILPKDLSVLSGASVELNDISLDAGDVIEGDASATSVVDYVISGGEQS